MTDLAKDENSSLLPATYIYVHIEINRDCYKKEGIAGALMHDAIINQYWYS